MPVLHDYQCEDGHVTERMQTFEERTTICRICCKLATRIVSAPALDLFKEERYEELGDDAPLISSKAQLAEECRKRKLYSRRLEDSYHRHDRRREI